MAEYRDEYIADVTRYVREVERGARAADDFGDKQDAASLAARRMALAADEAGDKAARAQRKAAEAAKVYEHAAKEAADAAQKLARGEIRQAEAARVQAQATQAGERAAEAAARAVREKERADIAATASAMANAKATDNQADQFRQLARAGTTAFRTASREGSTAFKLLEGRAKLTVGTIVAGIAALPVAAEFAGAAIAAGVGGGMIVAGLMASRGSKQIQGEMRALKARVSAEMKDISKPFEQTWMTALDEAGDTWDAFSAHLEDDFQVLAPAASVFVRALGDGLVRMRPGIDALANGFAALLRAIATGLPGALQSVGDGLEDIGEQLQKHPEDVARLVNGLIRLGGVLLQTVSWLMGVYRAGAEVAGMFADFGDNLGRAEQRLTSHIPVLGAKARADLEAARAAREHAGAVRGSTTAQSGLNAAQQIATMRALEAAGQFNSQAQFMSLASQSAKDLKSSLDALAGKELTARDAAANYGTAILAMNRALKDNGKQHGFATQKGLANEQALTQLARAAQDNAVAMRNDGKSARQVGDFMEGARKRIITAAQSMGYSRKEAIQLANKLMGVTSAAKKVPKGHNLNYNVRGNAVAQLNAISRAAYNAANALAGALAASMRLSSGGYVGFARGGPVGWDGAAQFAAGGYAHAYAQGYPVGGMVRGPGTGTSDSIPAWLSNGEYVINAAATRIWRPVLDAINYGKGRPAATSRASVSRPAGGGMTVVINVGGSVVSERDLVETVRRGLAQRSVYNPGSNGATVPRGV